MAQGSMWPDGLCKGIRNCQCKYRHKQQEGGGACMKVNTLSERERARGLWPAEFNSTGVSVETERKPQKVSTVHPEQEPRSLVHGYSDSFNNQNVHLMWHNPETHTCLTCTVIRKTSEQVQQFQLYFKRMNMSQWVWLNGLRIRQNKQSAAADHRAQHKMKGEAAAASTVWEDTHSQW